jgi:hypothetical protein
VADELVGDDAPARPTRVLVMAEYLDEDPLWDRSPTGAGRISAAELGLSAALTERLRAWNEIYNDGPPETRRWGHGRQVAFDRLGRKLANQVQNELRDIEVRYQDRPVRPD